MTVSPYRVPLEESIAPRAKAGG